MIQLDALPLSQHKQHFFHQVKNSPLLVEAEPGAGKSTLIPLWAMETCMPDKQIWLIQPRVLATLSLAKRLTDVANAYFNQQHKLGDRIGYQIPFDSRQSTPTQLVLMTPGILLQHLLHNPTLSNVACVILDEVHERSVNQDLAFAFLQEITVLRDDFQLILMSATPDPGLQKLISNRLFTAGRQFPVETIFLPKKKNPQQFFEESIAQHLLRALSLIPTWENKCCLVFLPGWKEIENCRSALFEYFPNHKIMCLHSRVNAQEQIAALNENEAARIILSTNIAETSLTIPDVALVIDSGLMRRVDYEQRTGLSTLRTGMISQSSADQRRGRAGRVQAGVCIRLWSQDVQLAASDLPEIRSTDYLPLMLRLAHWGSPIDDLCWIEKPNQLAMNLAKQELQKMEFLDQQYGITASGKKVSQLGTSPRVAALLLSQKNVISDQLLLLALIIHFDFTTDMINENWQSVAIRELSRNTQWQLQQKKWLSQLQLQVIQEPLVSLNIATAFSDRIGFLLASDQGAKKYRLNSGISVNSAHNLESEWAVFPIIESGLKQNHGLGFPLNLTRQQIKQLSQIRQSILFKQSWCEHQTWWIGGVMVDESFVAISASDIGKVLSNYLQQLAKEKNLTQLGWCQRSLKLLQRARIIQLHDLFDLPEMSEESLILNLYQWLGPFLTQTTKLEQLPWLDALNFYLGHDNLLDIQKIIPDKIELPSGRSVEIEINSHQQLQVSAKLQEFFGCEELILSNSILPLQIHLLSPNGSPLAITSDLKSFWKLSYPQVCKEMRGRYPRHPWPENPFEHPATALTKRKLKQQQ